MVIMLQNYILYRSKWYCGIIVSIKRMDKNILNIQFCDDFDYLLSLYDLRWKHSGNPR